MVGLSQGEDGDIGDCVENRRFNPNILQILNSKHTMVSMIIVCLMIMIFVMTTLILVVEMAVW